MNSPAPLILAALEIEVAGLGPCPRTEAGDRRQLVFHPPGQAKPIPVRITGAGPRRAAAGAAAALDSLHPSAVLIVGFAGACVEMTLGQVIAPGRVIDADGGRDYRPTRPGAGSATLVTVTQPLLLPEQKQRCRQVHGADAVDMETAAVAAECERRSVPWLCLRAITDQADQTIPAWALRFCDARGRPRPGAAVAHLLTHPWHIGPLWELRRGAHRAANALAQAIATHL